MYVHTYIVRSIDCILLPHMSQNTVHLNWLLLLTIFTKVGIYNWGSTYLVILYKSLCRACDKDIKKYQWIHETASIIGLV